MNGTSVVDSGTAGGRLRMHPHATAPAWIRCIAAIVLCLAGASVATAQPICPPTIVQGSGQKTISGIPSAPLVFRQSGNFATGAPVGNVQFDLTITGDAVFSDNGTRTRSIAVPWSLVAGANFEAAVNDLTITSGTVGGQIQVAVRSSACTVSNPIVFNVFGIPGNFTPAQILPVAGDGALIQPGQTVDLVARVPLLDRPARAPDGFTIQFRVLSGDGRFLPGGGLVANPNVDFNTNLARATLRAGSTEGQIVVEASSAGQLPARFTVTVQRQQNAVVVSGDGQSGRPGTTSQPLVLEVRDATGAPVAGATVTWGVAFGVGPVLTQAATVTGADGRTRNTFVFGSVAGESVIAATLPGGGTVRFRVITALGGLQVVSGDNQTGAAGSDADAAIVFAATDTSGRFAIGERVDFSVVGGSATLLNNTDVVNDRGTASVRFRYGSTPGTVQIRGAFLGGQFTATATATSFAASAAATSGNNQTAALGARLPQPLVVQLSQPPQGAKGLGGVPVTWTVTAGGGRLDNATTVTDANGRASNQLTLGPAAGTQSVRADIPGGGSVTFTANATAAVPGNATFDIAAGNNQALPTGAPSAPLVVRVRTAAGAPVSGATVSWRLTPAANGSLSAATSVTNAQGEASVVATLGIPGAANVIATLPEASAVPAVTFTLNGGVANTGGLTEAQTEIAGAIDAACPALARAAQGSLTAGQQDLLARCSELVGSAGSSPGDVSRALSQMLSDEAAAQDDAAFNTATAQFDNLKARIAALRSGSAGISLGGLALAGGGGVLPLSFLPSSLVADADEAGAGEVGADFSRRGFFASGTIGRGDRDAEMSSPGYEFDTYGLTAGVDYRWSDRFIIGGAFGYNNNDTDVDLDQGRLETTGYSGSLYATWFHDDAWYADAVLTYGRNSYDLRRRIRYQIRGAGGATQTVDQVATASPDGTQTQFALSVGRDFSRGEWSFGPYARTTLTQVDFDGYTERMSNPSAPGGGLALAVGSRELESLEGVLGGKLTYTMSTSWGVLVPHAQVEYLHEFDDDPEAIVARFVNDPTNTAILVPQSEVDTGYFNLGLGMSGVFANGRSAFVYYERRAGQSGYSQDSLALGVRIEF
ncbi:MAG: autotransporter domain-containing protein [Xanthomonadaceae bacterium]|nr:autotransporter domain-containing protein [Xanthomonadaceae bacterium]